MTIKCYLVDVRFGGRGLRAAGAGRIPVAYSCVQMNEHSVFLYHIIDHNLPRKQSSLCFGYAIETASLYKSTNQPPA